MKVYRGIYKFFLVTGHHQSIGSMHVSMQQTYLNRSRQHSQSLWQQARYSTLIASGSFLTLYASISVGKQMSISVSANLTVQCLGIAIHISDSPCHITYAEVHMWRLFYFAPNTQVTLLAIPRCPPVRRSIILPSRMSTRRPASCSVEAPGPPFAMINQSPQKSSVPQ